MPKKIKYKPPRRRSGRRVYKSRIKPASSASLKMERAGTILKRVLGAAAVILLVFLGYSIGAPIYNYFSERGNTDAGVTDTDTAWTPPVSETDVSAAETDVTEAPPEETTAFTSAKPAAVSDSRIMAYRLTENSFNDVNMLKSELKLIKTSGFNAAVITVKDENGCFNYSPQYDYAEIISDGNVKSPLTAAEITRAFSECGLIPVAKISVLKDSAYYGANSDLSYRTESGGIWTDREGNPWLSPYSGGTSDYVAQIIAELADAGFRYIICTDIEFPELEREDYSQIGDVLAFRDRYTALVKTVNNAYSAGEEHGAEVIPEVSFADVKNGVSEVFHPDELKCMRTAVLCSEGDAGELAPDSYEFSGMKIIPCYKGGDPDSALRTFAEKGFSDSIVY